MAGYGISCCVSNPRDIYHSESITKGLLLEVTESSVWDVLEGSITEHLEQGLVIHSDGQVTAAKGIGRESATARASPSKGE